jgi:hypothetical protein
MMKYKIVLMVVVLAFAKAEFLNAQDKQERESNVERTDFPEKAQKQLDVFIKKGRAIKFYREADGDVVSYEMKLKIDGRRHSVEFDEQGTLEDVEVTVSKRKIKAEAAKNIQNVLDQICSKNKIEKVQWQFLASGQNIKNLLDRLTQEKFDNYEMIVAFKEKRKIYRKELLFSSDGVLIQTRDIQRIAYDFLLF